MRVQRMLVPGSEIESWTLDLVWHVPVEPVERFLAFSSAIERSPNTVKAYAHDLKDWPWLNARRKPPTVEGARTWREHHTVAGVAQPIHILDRVRPRDHRVVRGEQLRPVKPRGWVVRGVLLAETGIEAVPYATDLRLIHNGFRPAQPGTSPLGTRKDVQRLTV